MDKGISVVYSTMYSTISVVYSTIYSTISVVYSTSAEHHASTYICLQ